MESQMKTEQVERLFTLLGRNLLSSGKITKKSLQLQMKQWVVVFLRVAWPLCGAVRQLQGACTVVPGHRAEVGTTFSNTYELQPLKLEFLKSQYFKCLWASNCWAFSSCVCWGEPRLASPVSGSTQPSFLFSWPLSSFTGNLGIWGF